MLDGFERILAAYHHVDKAQIPDDKIEDLRQCILPTDGDLMRYLAECGRSKILISTRLMPRALESIGAVAHYKLEGLEPRDAESLARGWGIKGTSQRILAFAGQFEYHPLVWRVVCGMAKDPPHRGDFDKWLDDPGAGGKLEIAKLDLKQRHTHILAFALAGLNPHQRQLLSRISVLSDNAAYETIKILNPFGSDAEFYSAFKNLEDRGLLQWEPTTNTYDLHPVVRASAYQVLEEEDREPTYNTLRNHFAALPQEDFEQATELAHLKNSLEIFRLQMGAGQLQYAARHYRGALANALFFSVGAYGTIRGMLQELIRRAGTEPMKTLGTSNWSYITNELALALGMLGDTEAARDLLVEKIRANLSSGSWQELTRGIINLGIVNFGGGYRSLAIRKRAYDLSIELSEAADSRSWAARATLDLADLNMVMGNYAEARMRLREFGSNSLLPRSIYQPGGAERLEAELSFRDGTLDRRLLDSANSAGRKANSLFQVCELGTLQAQWELTQGNPAAALAEADQVTALLHRSGVAGMTPHSLRAVALARLGRAKEARDALAEGGRAKGGRATNLEYLYATEVYILLGELDRARESVREAYVIAWADGPPFCWHWELERCRELMKQLGQPEPQLPPFDPAKVEKLPYEDDIRKAIEKLKADKAKAQ